MNDFVTALYALVLLSLLVGAGELMRRVLKWPAEISRKVIHAGTALLILVATRSFEGAIVPILLATPFVLVNLIAVPRRWLPSMHAIERRSWGTVTFPIAFIMLALTCWWLDPERILALQVAFVVVGLADPAAALSGTRWGRLTYDFGGGTKSWVGTGAFGVVAWVGTLVTMALLSDLPWGERLTLASLVALTTMVGEMLVGRGWDNLVVAALSASVVVAWIEAPSARWLMIVAVAVCLVAAILAVWLRFLKGSGALSAGLLGFVLLGLGGPEWMAPAVVFFVASSVLSKLGRKRKAAAREIADKGSRRDAGQVYANGGVAGWLTVMSVLWPDAIWYWGLLGAFAAAAADTWGTELGTYLRGSTRHVITGRRVEPGLSGGVSLGGTAGSVLGALAIGATALAFDLDLDGTTSAAIAVGLVALAGVIGAFADSVAGATVQAVYEDPSGHRPTERAESEQGPNRLVRGYAWIDNDRVNLICTFVGAAVALSAALIFIEM